MEQAHRGLALKQVEALAHAIPLTRHPKLRINRGELDFPGGPVWAAGVVMNPEPVAAREEDDAGNNINLTDR